MLFLSICIMLVQINGIQTTTHIALNDTYLEAVYYAVWSEFAGLHPSDCYRRLGREPSKWCLTFRLAADGVVAVGSRAVWLEAGWPGAGWKRGWGVIVFKCGTLSFCLNSGIICRSHLFGENLSGGDGRFEANRTILFAVGCWRWRRVPEGRRWRWSWRRRRWLNGWFGLLLLGVSRGRSGKVRWWVFALQRRSCARWPNAWNSRQRNVDIKTN